MSTPRIHNRRLDLPWTPKSPEPAIWRLGDKSNQSSSRLMRFLTNSNDEKKMALTRHDRPMDTPRPVRQWLPRQNVRQTLTPEHPLIKELNLGCLGCPSLAMRQAVALIYALGRVRSGRSGRQWKPRSPQSTYACPAHDATQAPGNHHSQRVRRRMPFLTSLSSCLLLSYVMK